jgi:hypothetical protein
MDSMIPYSPTLALQESYVLIYKIYILKDPITQSIFYVGQTYSELQTRLNGHISGNSGNEEKQALIKSIIDRGEKPIIEAVETIMGFCYIDKMLVNEREIYWIKYYKSQGVKLLNSALMNDDAECREYKTYLRAIQNRQTSYHYYYCGQTYGGVKVYDEKKLNADGFKLPTTTSQPYDAHDECYNPWNNPRWREKIGNKRFEGDDYTYEFVYRDTDPKYYDEDY